MKKEMKEGHQPCVSFGLSTSGVEELIRFLESL